jgi:hypothetical protein
MGLNSGESNREVSVKGIAGILKPCEIDFYNPPIQAEMVILINDVPLGTQGNLFGITGGEGTGKSNYVGSLIAGTIRDAFFSIDTLGATIVCVLHFIPNGMKLRGHLGSELQRKAAAILSIEKDEDPQILVAKALKVRDGSPLDVPLVQFS